MTKFKLITYRIGIVIAAIALGIFLVLLLTYMGQKSSGPIDDAFTAMGNGVSTIEHKLILNEREDSRSKILSWFNNYRNDAQKLAHTDKLLFGAYDDDFSESYQSVVNLEDSLGTHFPIIHIYTAWGSKPEEEFPVSQTKAILDIGSVPVITWEPWLADFDRDEFPKILAVDKRDKNGLKSIAKGDYDAYIINWANAAKELNKLFFVRLGHEMNDPYRYPWGPQNNKPLDFINAWRHVVNVFKATGASNVLWIWSPHPAYANFDAYYPGDEYVDWVGVGTLNYGTVASWSKWWSFDEIFGNYYPQLSKYKKPIIVTEFGSLAVGGNRAKWYKDALTDMPVKYPEIKAVIFFHCKNDNTTTYKALDWYIKDDTLTVSAIRNATHNFSPLILSRH